MAFYRVSNGGSLQFILVGSISAYVGAPYTRTISCTSVSGYNTKTANDFIVIPTSYITHGSMGGSGKGSDAITGISKSYNASTGVLTISGLAAMVKPSNWSEGTSCSCETYVSVSVYIITT